MKHDFTILFLCLMLLLTLTACASAGSEPVTEPAPARQIAIPTSTAAADPITKEGARKIALDHLGLQANQVKRLRTEYEIDNGICLYDVQFVCGDWKYEFEIHAQSGQILSFDREHKYD